MINRFKNAVNNVMGGISSLPLENQGESGDKGADQSLSLKFPYSRPDFLRLNADEVQVSADHMSRPIMVPRDITRIPWNSGYAEVINSGKTKYNEDQARAEMLFVRKSIKKFADPNRNCESEESHSPTETDIAENDPLPFTYFAVFDGHAGAGAALMAVNSLHNVIEEELSSIRELLIVRRYGLEGPLSQAASQTDRPPSPHSILSDKTSLIDSDSLVMGALERAFVRMDKIIEEDRKQFRITGGCTAVVAVFFLGKLYVANAGDSRAVIGKSSGVVPMSHDFTPDSERKRLKQIAFLKPELLHNEFTEIEFPRRVSRKDVGCKMLHRNAMMNGWGMKTITIEDTRFPLIYGEGKRTRLLATIGVSRGFGDHDLKVCDTEILIKPFLTPAPEVTIYDMSAHQHTADDVLIMGTDGLWDVTTNEKAAIIVKECLSQFEPDDRIRYTSAAQDLVMHARGLLKKGWKTEGERPASGDDITAFVIPLHRYCNLDTTKTENSDEAAAADS